MSSEEIESDCVLDSYIERLNDVEIGDLIYERIQPFEGIRSKFREWHNHFDAPELKLKFEYSNDFDGKLPADLLVMEVREQDDIYDSYIGMYQQLLFYDKDIIDKTKAPIGALTKQLKWYKEACDILIKNDLATLNTLKINYTWTLMNDLNNEKCTGNTCFYVYHYPVGIFSSNNLLPTDVWNRIIFRYPFMGEEMCFIPSITKSWSNSDKVAVAANHEFNKLLVSIIRFIERPHDRIYINNENVNSYRISSSVNSEHIKLDMTLDINGKTISVFDYRLLPSPTTYNSYYVKSFGPELFDIIKVNDLIQRLKRLYNSELERYGYPSKLFDDILKSFYTNTEFNVAILWWFINTNKRAKEIANELMFTMKDNIDRIFMPTSDLERAYYLSKIELVSDNSPNDINWLANYQDRDVSRYYTFNEMIHMINELVMVKDDHFFLKYQFYTDISDDQSKKKPSRSNSHTESSTSSDTADISMHETSLRLLDDMPIVFSYLGVLHKTTLKELFDRNYLTLNRIFSIQKSVTRKMYFDYDECVNYLYYLNGLLQNRYQNKNTLLYTFSNLLMTYTNDMRTLYIIGESQCGKSVFKNIILNYIVDYYEKTTVKQSDFNYDDAYTLKIYDDVDIMEKSKHRKTNLILSRDNYTVNINEKNKQPVKVYKNITNIVLNNDWPRIITWYHQRRIKTCLFVPNSRHSLEYAIERIFKNNNRCVGSFNDVFINNFFQFLISYRDRLYHEGVYYSDCLHLLDQDLPLEVLEENIKNILNLNSVNDTKDFIRLIDNQKVISLKQQNHANYVDYYLKRRFNILI